MIVLINLLEELDFDFWDLGMPMNYKTSMGAIKLRRSQFLGQLKKHRNKCRFFGFEPLKRRNFQLVNRQIETLKIKKIDCVSIFEMPIAQELFLDVFKERIVNHFKQQQNKLKKRISPKLANLFKNQMVGIEQIREYLYTLCHYRVQTAEEIISEQTIKLPLLIKEVQDIENSKVLGKLSKKQKKRMIMHFTKRFKLIE